MLVKKRFHGWPAPGRCFAWFSTDTSLAHRCGMQRRVALMQHPAILGTEVQQQGPVGTSALDLLTLYPAIVAQVCLCAQISGGEIILMLEHQSKMHEGHQHHWFIVYWGLQAVGSEPQTRV